jgi:hypothetical protein
MYNFNLTSVFNAAGRPSDKIRILLENEKVDTRGAWLWTGGVLTQFLAVSFSLNIYYGTYAQVCILVGIATIVSF